MSKKYDITEDQAKKLSELKKKNKNKNVDRRIQVLLLKKEGLKSKEIAEKTGYNASYVSKLATNYAKEGISVVLGKKREANRRNMSRAEEALLLEGFKQKALKGHVITVSEIKKAYDEKVGRESGKGQIYRVLSRHNWRKVKARGKHPKKATPEAIEASKKITFAWENLKIKN